MDTDFLFEALDLNCACDLQDLAKSVGWNFTSGQVNLFLSSGGAVFGYRHEGQLIASAGIYSYGSELASLGIVIVHADFQGHGLGKQVVIRCLVEAERTGTPVTLVATEQGFPLYRSLGFEAIGQVHRFELAGRADILTETETWVEGISVIQNSDLADIIHLDEGIFGAKREMVCDALFRNMASGVIYRDEQGHVRGVAMSVQRNDLLVIGPVMAVNEAMGIELVKFAASRWQGRVRIDVPSSQPLFMENLTQLGFTQNMVSQVMIRGAAALPGERNRLFGIVDPVFG